MNGQFDRALTSIGTGICQLEEHIEADRSNTRLVSQRQPPDDFNLHASGYLSGRAIQTSHGHVINVRLHFIYYYFQATSSLHYSIVH